MSHQLENIIDLDKDSEEEEEGAADKIKGLLAGFIKTEMDKKNKEKEEKEQNEGNKEEKNEEEKEEKKEDEENKEGDKKPEEGTAAAEPEQENDSEDDAYQQKEIDQIDPCYNIKQAIELKLEGQLYVSYRNNPNFVQDQWAEKAMKRHVKFKTRKDYRTKTKILQILKAWRK